MRRVVFALLVLGLVTASASVAQTCNEEITVGQFDVEFEGVFFDGTNSQFSYCVTNNGGAALSHWVLALELGCIDPEDLVDCGPDPCFYQVNDPTTGITGIKWDDTSVDPGETECFDFTLVGDWTDSIDNVQIGLKAGNNTLFGDICGPVCNNCVTNIEIIQRNGQIGMGVLLQHNRPQTVVRAIQYGIMDSQGNIVHRWEVGPITFKYLSTYRFIGRIPGLGSLPAGSYLLVMRLSGMSGWHWQTRPFFID